MVNGKDIFQENLQSIIGPHKFRYTEHKQFKNGDIEPAQIEGVRLTNLADYIKANLNTTGFKFVSWADLASVRKCEESRSLILLIRIQNEEAFAKFKDLILNYESNPENDRKNILEL